MDVKFTHCRELQRLPVERDESLRMTWWRKWPENGLKRWGGIGEPQLGRSGWDRVDSGESVIVKLHQDVAAVLQLKEADGCCGRFVGRFNPQSLLIFNANWPRNWSLPALRPLDIGDNPGVESVEKPPRGYSRQVKAHSCSLNWTMEAKCNCLHILFAAILSWRRNSLLLKNAGPMRYKW